MEEESKLTIQEFLKEGENVLEVVLNNSYGGFEVTKEMAEVLQIRFVDYSRLFKYDRSNPFLVDAVKRTKPRDLIIKEILWRDVSRLYIDDYDGMEAVIHSRYSERGEHKALVDFLFDDEMPW